MTSRTPTPLHGAAGASRQNQDTEQEAVDTAQQDTVQAAVREPSLYDDLLPNLSTSDRKYLTPLTPFARELQLWVWSAMERSRWSHADLARALGVAQTTVNSWFGSRGVIPEGQGWHKVLKVTGWPEAHLLHLTGYTTPPPSRPDVWDFLRERIAAAYETRPEIGAKLLYDLDVWRTDYLRVRSRPAHRPATRKAKAPKSR